MPKGLLEKLKEDSSKKHSVKKKKKEAKKIKEKVPMDDAVLNRVKEAHSDAIFSDKESKKSGLMSLEEFQKETHKRWSKRENVKQVDHTLNKYNQFVDSIDRFVGDGASRWEKVFLTMKSMLKLLALACNDYKKRGGTRDVDRLLSQAVEEEAIIDELLSEYYNSKEIFQEEKSEALEQGHDIYFELYCLKNTVENHLDIKFCEKLFSKLKTYQAEKETKGVREKVSGNEFHKQCFLQNKDLSGSLLMGLDFSGKEIWKTELNGTKLNGANLSHANLKNLKLKNMELKNATLVGADFRGTDLTNVDFRGANLKEANLEGAKFNNVTLEKANLNHANLQKTEMKSSDLTGAKLTKAKAEQLHLSFAEMDKMDLKDAYLNKATLSTLNVVKKVNFTGADARQVEFIGNWDNLNFKNTKLEQANFGSNKLSNIDFYGRNLRSARFYSTKFHNVDFEDVNLDRALLVRAELKNVDNLENVRNLDKAVNIGQAVLSEAQRTYLKNKYGERIFKEVEWN